MHSKKKKQEERLIEEGEEEVPFQRRFIRIAVIIIIILLSSPGIIFILKQTSKISYFTSKLESFMLEAICETLNAHKCEGLSEASTIARDADSVKENLTVKPDNNKKNNL